MSARREAEIDALYQRVNRDINAVLSPAFGGLSGADAGKVIMTLCADMLLPILPPGDADAAIDDCLCSIEEIIHARRAAATSEAVH